MLRAEVKLVLLNVGLAALAAFMGALSYAQAAGEPVQYDVAALASAGWAALRAAIGLANVYAQRFAAEAQAELEDRTKGFDG